MADYALSPKSVARDLYERAMTFADYVGYYGLARSEGLVLRYLSDAYKALRQTVPEDAEDRGALRPHRVARRAGPPGRLEPARRVGAAARTRPTPTVVAPDRRHAAAGHRQRPGVPGAGAQRAVPPGGAGRPAPLRRARRARRAKPAGTRPRWATALDAYFAEHDEIGTGADARGPALLMIDERPGRWIVRQIFDDPAGDHDWGISAEVDLAASDETGTAVISDHCGRPA